MSDPLRLMVGEYATIAPDLTYAVLRGGIDRWETSSFPLIIRLHVLVELARDAFTAGVYDIEGVLTLSNGDKIQCFTGSLEVVNPQNCTRFTAPIEAIVQAYGLCAIVVRVGSHTATWPLDVYSSDARDLGR